MYYRRTGHASLPNIDHISHSQFITKLTKLPFSLGSACAKKLLTLNFLHQFWFHLDLKIFYLKGPEALRFLTKVTHLNKKRS